MFIIAKREKQERNMFIIAKSQRQRGSGRKRHRERGKTD